MIVDYIAHSPAGATIGRKPHIFWFGGVWACASFEGGVLYEALGPTPARAFENWRWKV